MEKVRFVCSYGMYCADMRWICGIEELLIWDESSIYRHLSQLSSCVGEGWGREGRCWYEMNHQSTDTCHNWEVVLGKGGCFEMNNHQSTVAIERFWLCVGRWWSDMRWIIAYYLRLFDTRNRGIWWGSYIYHLFIGTKSTTRYAYSWQTTRPKQAGHVAGSWWLSAWAAFFLLRR